jgi:hypothetical protein
MKKRNAKKRTRVEYEVRARTFNSPEMGDFIPNVVTASFDFIERKQLRPLLTQLYEMDSESDVTIVEHSGPGRSRLIFAGVVTDCLVPPAE